MNAAKVSWTVGAVVYFLTGYGQTRNIDSLKNNIAKASTPQQHLKAIFALCEERQSFSADTLLFYLHEATTISKKII